MILTATPNRDTGSVVILGTNIPQTLATVYRYNDDGTTTILRGAQNMAITTGVLRAEDTEAPFNETLRYVVLFNIGDRVLQRNLITNPSVETNLTSWTTGAFRTMTRPTPPTPAFRGNFVVAVSDRAAQAGDSTTVAFEAPLARVDAPFLASTTASKNYEFSFRSRLQDTPVAYQSDATAIVGGAEQNWEQAYTQYPSWSMPFGQGLTWAQLETAYIDVPVTWNELSYDPTSAEWTAERGTWDGSTTRLETTPEVASERALNYATNPAITASTTGYTASSASGPVPVLSVVASSLQVTIASTSVSPKISFSASGLTVGTLYSVDLEGLVPTGQAFNIYANDGADTSYGVIGDSTGDWVSDSCLFTATSTTETFEVRFTSGVAGTVRLDRFKVSLPDVDYFDGDMPDDDRYFYFWQGTANNSISEREPYTTLYAPTGEARAGFEISWTINTLNSDPFEAVAGVRDAAGNELIDPIRTTITTSVGGAVGWGEGSWDGGQWGGGGTSGADSTFNAGGFGDVPFGGSNSGAIVFPPFDSMDWEPGWHPYIKVSDPGARLTYNARYSVYSPPTYTPYSIGVRARVLNPAGAIILTSDVLETATVVEWKTARWAFTLPPTVAGTYRVEIVPEAIFPAAVNAWELDGAMLEPNPPQQEGRLPYLDGAEPLPTSAVPGWFATEDIGEFDSSNGDAIIRWTGTAHASASEFLGPSQVTVVLETLLPDSGTVVEDIPECEPINLSDPTVPQLGAWFTLQSISDLSYEARSASFVVLNRRAPIVISQNRATPAGSMVLLLQTLNERQILLDLVASGRVLLLRNPDPSYPERDWYLSVTGVTESRIAPDHRLPYRKFTLEFQQVDRPGGLISVQQPVTWADVDAAYDTWGTIISPNSVLANADSWVELISKRPAVSNPMALGAWA